MFPIRHHCFLTSLAMLFMINNRSFLLNPIRYIVIREITIVSAIISSVDAVEVQKEYFNINGTGIDINVIFKQRNTTWLQ